ncbi:MAG: lytic murein transglycosylase, partial [Gammaproteobacteria bacterium]|nr:lytic murein transglycosylase [Gammaproteobacteria bacterium]
PVTARARVSGEYPSDWMNESLKPARSIAEFAAAGIEAQQPFAADALATAMKLEGTQGAEYWLGLHNFYVITRYNHSAMYAMSVYQLSQELESRR